MLGANLLESLFVLSFNHQNPQLGLIALTILPLHYTILLWGVGRRELMLDALLLKEAFNLRVLELRPVVASNFLDPQGELILSPSQESL